jgi:hypothetical protein
MRAYVNKWSPCRSWGGKVGRRGHSWAPKVASRKDRHNQHDTTTQNKEKKKTTQNTSTEKEGQGKTQKQQKRKRQRRKRKKKEREKKGDENQGHKGYNGFTHRSHPYCTRGSRATTVSSVAPTLTIGHKGYNGFIHRSHPHNL